MRQEEHHMLPLDVVKLTPLMARTSGKPHIRVGLIDGPVAINHPELAHDGIREISGNRNNACIQANRTACLHGTFIAGILLATADSL